MATAPTGQQSGLVTAVGIVDIVLGGLSLICGGVACLGGAVLAGASGSSELTKGMTPEQVKAIQEAGAQGGLIVMKSILYLILAAGLITAGIMVLKRMSLGRLLTMGCAVAAVVIVFVPPFDIGSILMGLVINGAFAGFVIWVMMTKAEEFA